MFLLAERVGFEPTIHFYMHTSFPGQRLRPLDHLSSYFFLKSLKNLCKMIEHSSSIIPNSTFTRLSLKYSILNVCCFSIFAFLICLVPIIIFFILEFNCCGMRYSSNIFRIECSFDYIFSNVCFCIRFFTFCIQTL